MSDLSIATAVEGNRGRYRGNLHDDWQIWGPMGGYVASVALRASACEVPAELTPASFTCQFVSTAKCDPVDIDVEVRRISRRAALVSSRMSQDGNAVLDAQAWFTTPSTGLEHDYVAPHRFGHPDDHPPISAYDFDRPVAHWWSNFDRKPTDWIDDWDSFEGGDPEWGEWLRFLPSVFDDPVVEACRIIVLADLPSYPAAIRAHPRTRDTWVAPSLDLAVQFHRLDLLGEWLLCRGVTPVAHRGLLAFRSEVWTAAGHLAATGSGQLLYRPIAPPT